MSTCSTATSALHSPESRRRDAGRLETRLRDLERDWDTYKTSRRSGASRHHRRSRSATATPSTAVTEAAPDDDLYAFLRCSPRRLVYSLQQDASDGGGGGSSSAGAVTVVEQGSGDQRRRHLHEEDASSVCFVVEAGHSMSSASSCSSRPCQCAVLFRGYSTSTATTESSFSLAAGDVIVAEHARKADEGRWMRGGTAGWFFAIAVVVLGVIIVAMAAVWELGIDEEDCAEFLVPT
ncbi:hypothetical protein EJB05_37440, partial [Eragrostis curvula]